MNDGNKTYVQVITDLLNKYKAEPDVIKKFLKKIEKGQPSAANDGSLAHSSTS